MIHMMKKGELIEYLKAANYYCEKDIRSAICFSSLKKKSEIGRPEFLLDTLGRIVIFQFKYVVVLEDEEWENKYGLVFGDFNDISKNIQEFNRKYSNVGEIKDFLINDKAAKEYVSFITLNEPLWFPKIRAIFHENFYY